MYNLNIKIFKAAFGIILRLNGCNYDKTWMFKFNVFVSVFYVLTTKTFFNFIKLIWLILN